MRYRGGGGGETLTSKVGEYEVPELDQAHKAEDADTVPVSP